MSQITDSARGEQCLVRIPGVCNRDPETVVFAHLNGGGLAMKHPDTEGAYCCSACHDVLDGRVPPVGYVGKTELQYTKEELTLWFHEGAVRTRRKLIDKELILCL